MIRFLKVQLQLFYDLTHRQVIHISFLICLNNLVQELFCQLVA